MSMYIFSNSTIYRFSHTLRSPSSFFCLASAHSIWVPYGPMMATWKLYFGFFRFCFARVSTRTSTWYMTTSVVRLSQIYLQSIGLSVSVSSESLSTGAATSTYSTKELWPSCHGEDFEEPSVLSWRSIWPQAVKQATFYRKFSFHEVWSRMSNLLILTRH